MRQGLYQVSIGLNKECFTKNYWLNKCDGSFVTIAMGLSPSLHYLIRSIEDPKELWKRLDRTFGMIYEDHNSTLESTSSTIRILDPKISASTLSDEVVQDEEEVEDSTQSIRIEHSLLAVTPSPNAPEVYEISVISSSHMDDPKEYI